MRLLCKANCDPSKPKQPLSNSPNLQRNHPRKTRNSIDRGILHRNAADSQIDAIPKVTLQEFQFDFDESLERSLAIDYPELKHNEIRDFARKKSGTKEINRTYAVGYDSGEESLKGGMPPLKPTGNLRAALSSEDTSPESIAFAKMKEHMKEIQKHNLDLATVCEREKAKSKKLQEELEAFKLKISQLKEDSHKRLLDQELRIKSEYVSFREEFQQNVQKIVALEAEKKELAESLFVSKVKLEEKCEELARTKRRLGMLQSMVKDLEKQLDQISENNPDLLLCPEETEVGASGGRRATFCESEVALLRKQKDEVMKELSELMVACETEETEGVDEDPMEVRRDEEKESEEDKSIGRSDERKSKELQGRKCSEGRGENNFSGEKSHEGSFDSDKAIERKLEQSFPTIEQVNHQLNKILDDLEATRVRNTTLKQEGDQRSFLRRRPYSR